MKLNEKELRAIQQVLILADKIDPIYLEALIGDPDKEFLHSLENKIKEEINLLELEKKENELIICYDRKSADIELDNFLRKLENNTFLEFKQANKTRATVEYFDKFRRVTVLRFYKGIASLQKADGLRPDKVLIKLGDRQFNESNLEKLQMAIDIKKQLDLYTKRK